MFKIPAQAIQSLIFSPLFGGTLASFVLIFYSTILYFTTPNANLVFEQILFISSLLWGVSIAFSYLTFPGVLIVALIFQYHFKFREGVLWFYMFIAGTTLGLIGGLIAHGSHSGYTVFAYSIAGGVCFLFNSSFFSVITKRVKRK